jgi:hypothetical protein
MNNSKAKKIINRTLNFKGYIFISLKHYKFRILDIIKIS